MFKGNKKALRTTPHGGEWNMGNIFRVSHIFQLISRDFRRVK